MPYVYVEERDPFATLIGFGVFILIVYWEMQSLILMLPGILAFLCSTFILCSLIVKLARRMGNDDGLAEVRGPGINPFASLARAVDAVAYALPTRYSRMIARPGTETSEALLSAGLGGLLAFGLACYASGALTTWLHTGRWSPTMPLLTVALGAATGSYGAKVARRWLDRTHPKRPDVALLDYRALPALDPTFAHASRAADEMD